MNDRGEYLELHAYGAEPRGFDTIEQILSFVRDMGAGEREREWPLSRIMGLVLAAQTVFASARKEARTGIIRTLLQVGPPGYGAREVTACRDRRQIGSLPGREMVGTVRDMEAASRDLDTEWYGDTAWGQRRYSFYR